MNITLAAAGALLGLGCFAAIREILPAPARLNAALSRLGSAQEPQPPPALRRKLARRLLATAPWLPVPTTDLRLLGQDTETWIAAKIGCGVLGLGIPALLSSLFALAGFQQGWPVPVVMSLAVGVACFMAPDLVTRASAAGRRGDFRLALTSYVDLVALELGAGAAPVEALEEAATLGGGWPFARIRAVLAAARRGGADPWTALEHLAGQIGVPDLADLAAITAAAGQEGAKILNALMSLAAAMRSRELAATQAKGASRTTIMTIPIAIAAGGFIVLLIFPAFYRGFLTG